MDHTQYLLNPDFSINYQSVTDRIIRRYFRDLDAYYATDAAGDGVTASDREKIRGRLRTVLERYQGDRILLIAHSMGDLQSRSDAVGQFVKAAQGSCESIDVTLGRSGVLLACAFSQECIETTFGVLEACIFPHKCAAGLMVILSSSIKI